MSCLILDHPNVLSQNLNMDPRIHLRLVELGLGLCESRLGAEALCLLSFDLPLRLIEVFRGSLHRGFLLMELGRELLGILNATIALLRQVLVARRGDALTRAAPRRRQGAEA
jgi:hypothetical protein